MRERGKDEMSFSLFLFFSSLLSHLPCFGSLLLLCPLLVCLFVLIFGGWVGNPALFHSSLFLVSYALCCCGRCFAGSLSLLGKQQNEPSSPGLLANPAMHKPASQARPKARRETMSWPQQAMLWCAFLLVFSILVPSLTHSTSPATTAR